MRPEAPPELLDAIERWAVLSRSERAEVGRALRLFIGWVRVYHDPDADFVLSLHLHEGNDEAQARIWWASALMLDAPRLHEDVHQTGWHWTPEEPAAVRRVQDQDATRYRRVVSDLDVDHGHRGDVGAGQSNHGLICSRRVASSTG